MPSRPQGNLPERPPELLADLDQIAGEASRAEERAGQVHADHPLPVVERQVDKRVRRLDPGAADENADRASERGDPRYEVERTASV